MVDPITTCDSCHAPLSSLGAACDRCLLRRAMELPDSELLGPGFLDDLPMPLEAEVMVGKYTILATVARGGMGVVYQARQAPLNRLVALKMLLGGAHAGEDFRRRFLQEAQAAARLNHPAIVKILDWGEDNGQPFFAMEFIEGADLGIKTRGQPLSSRRAAEIVLALAQAIEYAHSQGVLHRDLKPSNVLLDAQGAPRITDFGLAKQLDQTSSLTQTGDLLGTPGYLPPEQASSRFGKIGPWSDVYGLGGILYCLLTGRPPFVAASTTEVLRAVAEQEPPSPRHLNASVPADLETICLKCLEKEAARRYPNAQALADDLGRFLHNEAIHARPASHVYKAHKWVEKHRLPALFATIAILALVGGTAAAWRQALRAGKASAIAQQNERLARAESTKSRQTTAFLKELLSGVTPDLALGRDTRLLKEMVAVASARVDTTLTNQPEVEAEVREILAATSRQLALFNEALRHAERALVLRESSFGENGAGHSNALVALNEVALASLELGRAEKAADLLRRTLEIGASVWKPEDPKRLRALVDLARAEAAQGRYTNAEQRLSAVLEIQNRTLGPASAETLNTQRAQTALLQAQARYTEAERVISRVVEIYRRHFPPHAPEKFQAGSELAAVKVQLMEFPTASLLYQSVLEHQQALLGREHPHTLRTLSNLALVYGRAGRRDDADAMLREALAGLRKHAGEAHPDTLAALDNLAAYLIGEGRHVEAEPIVRQVVESYVRMRGADHPDTLSAQIALSRVHRAAGRKAEAEATLHDTLDRGLRALGSNHTHTASALKHLATLEAEREHWSEAEAFARRAVASLARARGEEDRDTLQARHQLAHALFQQGQRANAEAMHRKNLAAQERALGADHPDTIASLQALAEVATALGKTNDAKKFVARLEERQKKIATNAPSTVSLYTGSTLAYTRADTLFREGKFAEAEPIFRALHHGKVKRGETNSETALAIAGGLGRCLSEWAWADRKGGESLAHAKEAERILRECLALRESGDTKPKWRLYDSRSRLGFAIASVAVNETGPAANLRAERFAEAEKHLLESFAALEADTAVTSSYRQDAISRLARLYEAWPQPAEGAKWKARLDSTTRVVSEAKP